MVAAPSWKSTSRTNTQSGSARFGWGSINQFPFDLLHSEDEFRWFRCSHASDPDEAAGRREAPAIAREGTRRLWPRKAGREIRHWALLEPEEEKRVLDAASVNPSMLIHPFLMILVWTGVRSDEARLLQWRQVDFDAGEILVGKKGEDRGRAGRVIPARSAPRWSNTRHAWRRRSVRPSRTGTSPRSAGRRSRSIRNGLPRSALSWPRPGFPSQRCLI